VIYLDTHIPIWLYAGKIKLLSERVCQLIESDELFISPMVSLEIQYLFEIDRISVPAEEIIQDLTQRIGLKICKQPFLNVIASAIKQKWTRDPFDRIIVSQAQIKNAVLLSKDKSILSNYQLAQW